MQTYAEVLEHWKKIETLSSAQSILYWDMETYMPEGSTPARQAHLTLMSSLIHQWTNDPKFKEAVLSQKIIASTDIEKRNLELWTKSILVSSAVDEKFVAKFSKISTECNVKWRAAKKESNFQSIEPIFKELVSLCRENLEKIKNLPELKSRYADKSLYGVAFDQFEPGLEISDMEKLLTSLTRGTKDRLPEFLEKSKKNKKEIQINPQLINKEFCKDLMSKFAFDFTKGRLDESTHPFCGGTTGDVRLTTRLNPTDAVEDLFSTLHELGHALYEQGLPEKTAYEPAGKACSMGVHESQSRFLENFIGRSRAFTQYLSRKLNVNADALYSRLNPVKLDYIRVDSDEVTYNFHILLRFEIERDLMEGKLEVKDLPEKWNTRFQELTGLQITKDSLGCLQDTHWYSGSFGYFPSYSLGNMFGAELFVDFQKAHPEWSEKVSAGHFEFIRNFMAERVYPLAAHHDSPQTMQKIIGRKVSEQTLLHYFDKKFS